LIDDGLRLLNVVDLGVQLIHLIFGLVDLLLVCVSEFELEVLCANCERQVLVVQVPVVYLLHHLASARWNWEAIFNSVITRVRNLLKCLVFGIVPRLEQVALSSSVHVSGRQQLFDLVLDLLLEFVGVLLLIELAELGETEHTLKIQE